MFHGALLASVLQTENSNQMFLMFQASAAFVAAGVAAGALAVRYILRNASRPAGAAAPGFFKSFQFNLTGSAEKGFESPMSKGEAAKILGIRYT